MQIPVSNQRNSRKFVWISLAILTAYSIFFSVHYTYYSYLAEKGPSFVYAGEPLLTSADGYFYLDVARRMSEDGGSANFNAKEQQAVGLMTWITVKLHEATGVSLQKTAFFLPPVIGSLMIPALFLWGAAIKRLEAGFIGAVMLSLSPYWFLRTRVGFFDTDSLIPFLALMGPYFVMRFATIRSGKRFLYLAAAIVISVTAYYWWPQIPYFGFLACFAAYLCSVAAPSNRPERILKIVLITLSGAFVVLGLAGIPLPVAKGLNSHLHSLLSHARLVFMKGGGEVLPKVLVGELHTLDQMKTLKIINGSYIGVAAAIPGVIVFFTRQWRQAIFLLPVLGMAAMFVVAARFAIFFLPVYALGIGYLCGEFYRGRMVRETLPRVWHRIALTSIITLSIAAPSTLIVYTLHLNPAYNSTQAEMAAKSGELTDPDTLLWSDWSKGYFLKYYSRRPVFADGGTLSPLHLYISEAPLAMESPKLAANWIRFFAERQSRGLRRFAKQLGLSNERAIGPLKEIFTAEDPSQILAGHGLKPAGKWLDYLFPNAKVALSLNHIMLRTAPDWFRRGTWDIEAKKGIEGEILRFQSGGAPVEKFVEGFRIGRSQRSIGAIYRVDNSGVHKEEAYPSRDGTLVEIKGEDQYYYLGPKFEKSLFYQLYLGAPADTPRFKQLFYEPRHAGLWLVE